MPSLNAFTADDFDLINDFLMSDEVSDDAMTLPILDGFLTAIAIGPEIIMPSEWFPQIWGGHSPEWRSEIQAELVMGAILSRYNEILRTIKQGVEYFEPIMSEYSDNKRMGCEEWSYGFMQGLALRREAWEPMFQSETHRGFIGPMAVQNMSEKEVLEADAEEGENNPLYNMWKNGADMIPEAVVEIDRFWERLRSSDQRHTKTGRNDLCPCGSGKKHKKCCGTH